MKRTGMLFLALCLALFLAACAKAEDPDNLFEIDPALSGSEPAPAPLEEPEAAPADAGDYPYGNMQKNAPPGGFMLYGGEVVFFRDQLLYAFDPATEEVNLLCRDATCSHIACVSGAPFANVEQYGGRLYAMDAGWQITELQGGKYERIAEGGVYSFWHAGGKLYAVTQDGSLVTFEKNGKPRILVDEYTSIWNVVFGQYLYGNSTKGVTRVDLSAPQPEVEFVVEGDVTQLIDGEHIYYMSHADETGSLYRCNLDGSGTELLLERQVLPASWNFDEDYLYFRLYDDTFFEGGDDLGSVIYRMKKDDPAETEPIAEFPENVYQVYTVPGYDKLFVTKREGDGVYLVAKDGSSVVDLEFPDV